MQYGGRSDDARDEEARRLDYEHQRRMQLRREMAELEQQQQDVGSSPPPLPQQQQRQHSSRMLYEDAPRSEEYQQYRNERRRYEYEDERSLPQYSIGSPPSEARGANRNSATPIGGSQPPPMTYDSVMFNMASPSPPNGQMPQPRMQHRSASRSQSRSASALPGSTSYHEQLFEQIVTRVIQHQHQQLQRLECIMEHPSRAKQISKEMYNAQRDPSISILQPTFYGLRNGSPVGKQIDQLRDLQRLQEDAIQSLFASISQEGTSGNFERLAAGLLDILNTNSSLAHNMMAAVEDEHEDAMPAVNGTSMETPLREIAASGSSAGNSEKPSELQSEVSKALAKLSERNSKEDELLEGLSNENSGLRKQVRALKQEKDELVARVKSLTDQLKDTHTQLQMARESAQDAAKAGAPKPRSRPSTPPVAKPVCISMAVQTLLPAPNDSQLSQWMSRPSSDMHQGSNRGSTSEESGESKKLKELKELVDGANASIADLREQLEDSLQENRRQKTTISQLNSKLQESEAKLNDMTKREGDMQERLFHYESLIARTPPPKESEAARKRATEAEKEVEDLRNMLDRVRRRLAQTEEEARQHFDAAEGYKDKAEEAQRRVKNLEAER